MALAKQLVASQSERHITIITALFNVLFPFKPALDHIDHTYPEEPVTRGKTGYRPRELQTHRQEFVVIVQVSLSVNTLRRNGNSVSGRGKGGRWGL